MSQTNSIPGVSNNKSDSFGDWISLKCKMQKDASGNNTQPMFIVLGENYTETDGKYNQVEGVWRGIGTSKWYNEEKKTTTYNFKVFLMPDGEGAKMLAIEFTFSMYTRGIITKLLHLVKAYGSLATNQYISLRTYPDGESNDGKKIYAGVSMKNQAGVNVPYGMFLDEIPSPREVKDPETGEVIKRIYDAVDQFYANLIAESIYPQIGPDNPGRCFHFKDNEKTYHERCQEMWREKGMLPSATPAEAPPESIIGQPEEEVTEPVDDDLPF